MAHSSKHMTSIINFAFASSKCNDTIVSNNDVLLKQRLVI